MKILYVGPTHAYALGLNYVRAFEQLGAKVSVFDPRLFETANLASRVWVRLKKQPLPSKIESVEIDIVKKCMRGKFDLVFVMAENFLSAQWMNDLRDLKFLSPVLVYHSHDNNFSNGILKPNGFWNALAAYDFAFTTKSQNVSRYQELGQKNSYFIASAFSPEHHHPISQEQSKYRVDQFGVTFAGTYDKSREVYLNRIDPEFLNVWGNGWKKYHRYNRLKKRIVPFALYNEDFADIVSHSQINLGLLREEAEDLHTTRTFEIPACGGLQLAPRNDEILSFFKEDKEIVCFDSPDEMSEKIGYLLKNSDVRQKIAKAGHLRCLKDSHTYLDRSREMLRLIHSQTSNSVFKKVA